MNLIDLFDGLSSPEVGNDKVFNAVPITDYPNFKMGIDIDGNPVLLLSVVNPVRNISLKNFRLKYLQLQQNVECKVTENAKTYFKTFTIITFLNAEPHLQEYFLRIAETVIRALKINPTQEQVINTIIKFVEVFRALSDNPINSVQGLWGELFLINNSRDPKVLLNYWHCFPEEKFDFNSGVERIEVKSSSSFERIHTFSAEQLNPKQGIQVLIASIFIRQSNVGENIQQLIQSITKKIDDNIELVDKLNILICRTLGSTLEQAIKIKYDYQIAKDSLRFYKHQDISKIEEVHIPNEVTEVRYKSDLSNIKSILPQEISSVVLFNSL